MSNKTCSFKIAKVKDSDSDSGSFSKLSAAIYASKIWDYNNYPIIKYGFVEEPQNIEIKDSRNQGIDPLQKNINNNIDQNIAIDIKDEIKKIADTINKFIGIKLTYTDDITAADIKIGFDVNDGAWSLLGTDTVNSGNNKTMNFGWFDVATVFHEFFHALGMVHEHQNPFMNPFEWDREAIYADFNDPTNPNQWTQEEIDSNIINAHSFNNVNSTEFDKDSIMLYWFPREYTKNKVEVTQNLRISPRDVFFLNLTYPIKDKNSRQVITTFFKEHFNEDIDYDNLSIKSTTPNTVIKPITYIGSFGDNLKEPINNIKNFINTYKYIIIVCLLLIIIYKILKK
jgi:hypothetical protein